MTMIILQPVCETYLTLSSRFGLKSYNRGCRQRKVCSSKQGCETVDGERTCFKCDNVDRVENCTDGKICIFVINIEYNLL